MKKKIGFICPLSKEGSDIRKRSDDIMENIIEPVADELGYSVERADKLYGSVIMDDIIKMLREADIIIADLSGANPNVFYELGMRQAIKGKCINIIDKDEDEKLPFDLEYYRAIKYEYNPKSNTSYGAAKRLRDDIKRRILNLENIPWDSCMNMEMQDIADIFNVTIVTDFLKGAKNHYTLAKNLFKKPIKNLFLMQRSSSLILNAEQGWGEEGEFLENIKRAIDECGFFYHIIAIDGIEAHFKRKNSVFPQFKNFSKNIENINGNVAIKKNSKNEKIFYLRKLPKDNQNSLFKLDRQARVLIAEYMDGHTSAVIVQNLGTDQTCFLLEGPKAKEYLDVCIDFYNTCELVEWREIVKLYKKYERVELTKGKITDMPEEN